MEHQNDAMPGKREREDVKHIMEKATQKEPSEFRDEANEQKQVEIDKDLTRHPIQGIDPKTCYRGHPARARPVSTLERRRLRPTASSGWSPSSSSASQSQDGRSACFHRQTRCRPRVRSR